MPLRNFDALFPTNSFEERKNLFDCVLRLFFKGFPPFIDPLQILLLIDRVKEQKGSLCKYSIFNCTCNIFFFLCNQIFKILFCWKQLKKIFINFLRSPHFTTVLLQNLFVMLYFSHLTLNFRSIFFPIHDALELMIQTILLFNQLL